MSGAKTNILPLEQTVVNQPLVPLDINVGIKGLVTLITIMTRPEVGLQISFVRVGPATTLVRTQDLWTIVSGGHVGSKQLFPLRLVSTFHAVMQSILLPLT